jgi:hypothetical protein
LTTLLDGYRFDKRLATGKPDNYVLLFRRGDQQRLAVWTTAADPRTINVPASPGAFRVVGHRGDDQPRIQAEAQGLSITVTDAPRYLMATAPNAGLTRAPEAFPLQARIVPGPGRMLAVDIESHAGMPFAGRVRLLDCVGIQPTVREQAVKLSARDEKQRLAFPLEAPPAGAFRVGLQVVHEAGHAVLTQPARDIVPLPDGVLTGCRIVPDGDKEVASEQRFAIEPAPKPLLDAETTTAKITYRFGKGWKFLRVIPGATEGLAIAGRPRAFGLWIYGDAQRTSPRLRVVDTTGQTWQPTGPTIDWQGWRYAEFPLTRSSGHWGGAADGVIHFPLVWDSLFLLDNPSKTSNRGTIYIAAPMIVY